MANVRRYPPSFLPSPSILSYLPVVVHRSLSSSVSIRLMSRRQFADWLEELYNDILELIVSPIPPRVPVVPTGPRNAFGEAECQEANCLYEDTFEACMQGLSGVLARGYRLKV